MGVWRRDEPAGGKAGGQMEKIILVRYGNVIRALAPDGGIIGSTFADEDDCSLGLWLRLISRYLD